MLSANLRSGCEVLIERANFKEAAALDYEQANLTCEDASNGNFGSRFPI
jgi:hypothetical protein